jgi:hypothetical protein
MSGPTRGPRAALAARLALFLTVAAGLAACSGHTKTHALAPQPPATSAAAPSPSASPKPAVKPGYPPGHFSGLPTKPGSPAFAVKIENTALGRPQAGINDADLIYVEQVEGGLTRLLAVYNSRLPTLLGPVRSARADNVNLLAQFGPIAFGYSGAQPAVLNVVAASDLVDVGFNDEPSVYERLPGRYAPENLFVDPRQLLALKHGIGARDIGLRFGNVGLPPVSKRSVIDVVYPAANISFSYDAASQSYSITQDGDLLHQLDGKLETTKNIIVQHIQQTSSGYVDVLGNATPANVTTGRGIATVYRNGRQYGGTWTRPADGSPTVFRYANGKRQQLNPGTTWILLLPPDGSSSSH